MIGAKRTIPAQRQRPLTDGFALPPAWAAPLADAMTSPRTAELRAFLDGELQVGRTIYPPQSQWFQALEAFAPDDVKVVILGQDPYHGPGQAHGLSFSVPPDVRVPPSLANIYKELAADTGFTHPGHGSLTEWAAQGVLLLNSVLTVEAGKAASHQKRGWEEMTDAIIAHLAVSARPIVFLLWGAYAQRKADFISDDSPHLVLRAAHPSPLSAHNGFLGCRHFSAANAFLESTGQTPIRWQIGASLFD